MLNILPIVLLLPVIVLGQSKFGFEVKVDRAYNYNSGQMLAGGGTGYSWFTVTEEKNLVTYSQSLGIVYRLNERNLFKLHLGNHQKGRNMSLYTCDDQLQCDTISNVPVIYHYLQIAPSYAFRVINKRIIVPIEVGININHTVSVSGDYLISNHKVNFDYALSTGIEYRLDPELIMGLHGLFTGNINEYQNAPLAYGTYKPKALGLQFSILYEFGKSLQDAEDVR